MHAEELDKQVSEGVAATWGLAMQATIALLEDMANKMENNEVATPCGICALRGAAGILREAERKRSRIVEASLDRVVGHA